MERDTTYAFEPSFGVLEYYKNILTQTIQSRRTRRRQTKEIFSSNRCSKRSYIVNLILGWHVLIKNLES
jgi:hypothetical protein